MIAHDLLTLRTLVHATPNAVVVFNGSDLDAWRHYECWQKFYFSWLSTEGQRAALWGYGYSVRPVSSVVGICTHCYKVGVPSHAD